jgi:hypothetical protein
MAQNTRHHGFVHTINEVTRADFGLARIVFTPAILQAVWEKQLPQKNAIRVSGWRLPACFTSV